MIYETYSYIFLGGAILAGIMLAVSVLLFFLLKIPTVIGDLTGSNARKAIENIRNHNESTGDRAYRISQANRKRENKISSSGGLGKVPTPSIHRTGVTEEISNQKFQSEDVANETTILAGELVGGNDTTVLNHENNINETAVLNAQPFSHEFVVEYEITYIHTGEVIA